MRGEAQRPKREGRRFGPPETGLSFVLTARVDEVDEAAGTRLGTIGVYHNPRVSLQARGTMFMLYDEQNVCIPPYRGYGSAA